MVIFHGFLLVYQRVNPIKPPFCWLNPMKPPFNYHFPMVYQMTQCLGRLFWVKNSRCVQVLDKLARMHLAELQVSRDWLRQIQARLSALVVWWMFKNGMNDVLISINSDLYILYIYIYFLVINGIHMDFLTGVGNCPILGILDITKNSSHGIDHIPNGWVMFNGDI